MDTIKANFPEAKFEKIEIRRGTGKNEGKIVAIGPKNSEYKILKDDDTGFMKSFLDTFNVKLGDTAEEIMAKNVILS